jgi:hypothetical protein
MLVFAAVCRVALTHKRGFNRNVADGPKSDFGMKIPRDLHWDPNWHYLC